LAINSEHAEQKHKEIYQDNTFSEASFDKMEASRLGPQRVYRRFPEDNTYADLYMEMVSISF
jgi:hypothetical protein